MRGFSNKLYTDKCLKISFANVLKILLTPLNVVSVVQVFEKSITSPVLVSFASEPTPIWEIPFPALTVCNMNKVTIIKIIYQVDQIKLKQA